MIKTNQQEESEYMRHRRLLSSESIQIEKITKVLQETNVKTFIKKAKEKGHKLVLIPLDESNIRKPESWKMEKIMKVKGLKGETVNGYRTINTVGVTPDGNNVFILQTKACSSKEEDFKSENIFKEEIIRSITEEIRKHDKKITVVFVLDRGFDDQKIFQICEDQGAKFVCRVKDMRRWIKQMGKSIQVKAIEYKDKLTKFFDKLKLKGRLYQNALLEVEWAEVEYELEDRKNDKKRKYNYTVIKSTLYKRPERKGKKRKTIYKEPMIMVTNLNMEELELSAYDIYWYYLYRWKIETVFKFLKETLGLEKFRVRDLKGIKIMIAMVFIVGAYLYEMGQGLIEEEFAVMLSRIGGWTEVKAKGHKRKLSRQCIQVGLQRIFSWLELQKYFEDNNFTEKEKVELFKSAGLLDKYRSIKKKV